MATPFQGLSAEAVAATLHLTPGALALIAGAFFLAGLVKGTIGLGLPVVVTAVLAAPLGLKTAVALLVVPGFLTNVWQGLVGGRFWELIRRLWPMLAAAVVGIAFGVKALKIADGRMLVALLGTILIVYASIALIRAEMPAPGRHERVLSIPIGAVSGFLFGLMGSYMVPGVLYVQAMRLGRDAFVQALGITFCVISLTLGISLGAERMIGGEHVAVSAAALLPTIVGMLVGQRLRRHLDEARFRRLFFVGLVVSGAFMIARTLLG
ncbi:MAG: sulfite exporter TauE/SafE family protein [Hyphomicrobiaceae bacterium]